MVDELPMRHPFRVLKTGTHVPVWTLFLAMAGILPIRNKICNHKYQTHFNNEVYKDVKAGLVVMNSSKVLVRYLFYVNSNLRVRAREKSTTDTKPRHLTPPPSPRPPLPRRKLEFSGFQHLLLPIAHTNPLANIHGHPRIASTPQVSERSRRLTIFCARHKMHCSVPQRAQG